MTRKMSARLVVAGLVAAVALPMASAPATEHCSSPINFLTWGTGLLYDPSAIGCDIIAEDFPETPSDDSDTRYIIPGSSAGVVWWQEGSQPVDGTRLEDGTVVGSRIELSGTTTVLRFTPGENITGELQVWESQTVGIGRTASLTAVATITVCRDAEGTDCETAVYRGIAAA